MIVFQSNQGARVKRTIISIRFDGSPSARCGRARRRCTCRNRKNRPFGQGRKTAPLRTAACGQGHERRGGPRVEKLAFLCRIFPPSKFAITRRALSLSRVGLWPPRSGTAEAKKKNFRPGADPRGAPSLWAVAN